MQGPCNSNELHSEKKTLSMVYNVSIAHVGHIKYTSCILCQSSLGQPFLLISFLLSFTQAAQANAILQEIVECLIDDLSESDLVLPWLLIDKQPKKR
jgi:hypothetical protein